MRKLVVSGVAGILFAVLAACSGNADLVVGAIYPLDGSQGPGGLAEARGVRLAAELANRRGGVAGRRIVVRELDVPRSDAAPAAVRALHKQGIRLVLGSYGSTISLPAADEAARLGMVFWETGAVGEMSGAGAGRNVFRVSPTGGTLGKEAVAFIAERVAVLLKRPASSLRFGVAYVDDVYGRAVARGALAEIARRGLPLAADVPYDAHSYDAARIVRSIAAAKTDVLFVSAYLQDGVAIRRETVRQKVPLAAAIGTSSSFCMLEFGSTLGKQATGLFASDKPDTGLNAEALTPDAREILDLGGRIYRERYGDEMDPPALAGFSAAWGLFKHVMPRAGAGTPAAIAAAAAKVRVPAGGLPNGSGLEFGALDSPLAGENLRAASVIWEWTTDGKRTVVWPPQFAMTPVQLIPIA